MDLLVMFLFIGGVVYLIHRKIKKTRIKAKRWNTQRKRNKDAGIKPYHVIRDNYDMFIEEVIRNSPGKKLIPINGFHITKGSFSFQYINAEIIINDKSENYRIDGIWSILRNEMKESKYYDVFHGGYKNDFSRALEYICKRIFYDFEWINMQFEDENKELVYEMDIRFYIRKDSYYNDIEIIKEKRGYCRRIFEVGYETKNFTFYDIGQKTWQ